MVTGPVLVTIGPDADGGLAVIAAGTALLSLLVLARLSASSGCSRATWPSGGRSRPS